MVNTEDTGEQPNVDIENNLATFEQEFYGKPAVTVHPEADEKPEELEEEEVEEEVSENPEDESLATENEEDEEEEAPKPNKKRHSAQERFNELTAEKHEERRAKEAALSLVESLQRELETLKAGKQEKEQPEDLRSQLPPNAPDPDAKDAEGNPIYELGEFDPKYIRDITKFTIAEETRKANEERAAKEWEEGVAAAQQELVNQWSERVAEVEAELPTIRDDITNLTETFESLEPNYGEYLAMTIMQCENGPEIMHYFSNNIGEAQKIVAAGPAAATLAIGRLEAQLSKSSTKRGEQTRNKTVSKAPAPPESGARGVNGRQNIRPDTNNLDAFEKIFYEK